MRSLILLALLIVGMPAAADELSDRVRALYRPYEKESGATPSAATALGRMAATPLKTLLDKDAACSRRSQGICNLDFDAIVNGQDYKITDVRISETERRGERASVTARFRNYDTAHETRYDFVTENGHWRLADVEALIPSENRWRLTSILSPRKRH